LIFWVVKNTSKALKILRENLWDILKHEEPK
jgi:hypothetical protein